MKPKMYPLIEMCIKNGIDYGWARAHKHFEHPPEGIVKKEIEDAISHEIYEWFDIGEDE